MFNRYLVIVTIRIAFLLHAVINCYKNIYRFISTNTNIQNTILFHIISKIYHCKLTLLHCRNLFRIFLITSLWTNALFYDNLDYRLGVLSCFHFISILFDDLEFKHLLTLAFDELFVWFFIELSGTKAWYL